MILIVDDNEPLRNLLVMFLREYHYTALAAANAEEALQIAAQYNTEIDLLLTDVRMPTMNGKELANHLRQTHPKLKVVYMSGYSQAVIAQEYLLEANSEFIQKPFTPQALAEQISKALDDQ